jgi:hypothetical protein
MTVSYRVVQRPSERRKRGRTTIQRSNSRCRLQNKKADGAPELAADCQASGTVVVCQGKL